MFWKLQGFDGQRKEAAGEARVLGHQGLDLYLGEKWAGQGATLAELASGNPEEGTSRRVSPILAKYNTNYRELFT